MKREILDKVKEVSHNVATQYKEVINLLVPVDNCVNYVCSLRASVEIVRNIIMLLDRILTGLLEIGKAYFACLVVYYKDLFQQKNRLAAS